MCTIHSMFRWLALVMIVSFTLILGGVFVSAAPHLGVAPVDGDGLMVVAPTSITYGGGSANLMFTFTANADFGAGSQVQIDIPTGWTIPTTAVGAGHVSVNKGTCTLNGTPPFTITGMSILVDITSCPTNASFAISYASVTPGAVSGSPYTFVTWSDIGVGGSGLVPINATAPTVSVNPKTLTVSATGLTPASRVYNSTTSATLTIGSPTLVGIVGTDSVTIVTSGVTANFVDQHTGISKIVNIAGLTLGGAQAGNYTLTQPTRTATITKRALTIVAVTNTKIYDGSVSSTGAPVIAIGALQGSDTASWTESFNSKHIGTGKLLTPAGVVNDGNSGNDYSYTYTSVSTGRINKKAITITAVTDSKIYDGTIVSTGIPQIAPALVGSDTPAFIQQYATKNVGTGKTIIASGAANDGNNGNNYSYTFVTDTTGTITIATPTLSITNSSISYDGLSHVAIVTSSVPGIIRNIQYNNAATAPTSAGTYAVTAHFTPTDTLNYNSLLPGAAGNFLIAKVTPTLSITNSAVTYDGSAHTAVITSSVAGVVSNIQYNGSTTIPAQPGMYVVTADFTPTDMVNYNSLLPGAAGNFLIRILVFLPLVIK